MMLRQLLALFALIAGLNALPASAEVRLAAQSSGQVELSASHVDAARASNLASISVNTGVATADGHRMGVADLVVPAVPRLALHIGIDRAHE